MPTETPNSQPPRFEDIPEPTIVTAREHLEEIAAELAQEKRVAIDIESNSFYAYRERVCLVQMSTSKEDFIVDPVAFADLSSLAPVMADPAVEKIFHAGEYDVLCLKRDYGFSFTNLFDTMIATRVLGFKELGLAAAIERHFGVKLSKKLQRADWGKRPLTQDHIRYAQLDTHYLLRLSDIQKEALKIKGRLEDALEAFGKLAKIKPVSKTFDPEGYWRLTSGKDLSPTQLSCLREIYLFRENESASRDKAPFRVMPEDLMLKIALALPADHAALRAIRGMSPYLHQRYGDALLDAVRHGKDNPVSGRRPASVHHDPREWKIFEELRRWRKAQAGEEGVETVVILTTEELKEIARVAFAEEGDPLHILSPLKRGRYGEAIHLVLKAFHR